jgi:5-methylcytosine-specific restriction endonuclease McrA
MKERQLMKTNEKCSLCGLETQLTIHHLIPKVKCHHNLKNKEDDPTNHLLVCRACHDAIHANFSENELRDFYSTKQQLLDSEEI